MVPSVITLTRLSGSVFALNSDLIERVDSTPDTVITLVDGTKYVVVEPLADVVRAIREYRGAVIAESARLDPVRDILTVSPLLTPPAGLPSAHPSGQPSGQPSAQPTPLTAPAPRRLVAVPDEPTEELHLFGQAAEGKHAIGHVSMLPGAHSEEGDR
jgi:flagellar protein FlbD